MTAAIKRPSVQERQAARTVEQRAGHETDLLDGVRRVERAEDVGLQRQPATHLRATHRDQKEGSAPGGDTEGTTGVDALELIGRDCGLAVEHVDSMVVTALLLDQCIVGLLDALVRVVLMMRVLHRLRADGEVGEGGLGLAVAVKSARSHRADRTRDQHAQHDAAPWRSR